MARALVPLELTFFLASIHISSHSEPPYMLHSNNVDDTCHDLSTYTLIRLKLMLIIQPNMSVQQRTRCVYFVVHVGRQAAGRKEQIDDLTKWTVIKKIVVLIFAYT